MFTHYQGSLVNLHVHQFQGRYQAEISLYTGPGKRGRHLGCAKTELEVRT